MVDDGHRLAQVLDQVELMAGKQHRHPGRHPFGEHLRKGVDGDRVEAREGLVEDQQLRVVDEGGGQLDPLLVAEGQRLDLVLGPVDNAKSGQPGAGSGGRVGPIHPVEPAEVDQLVEHLHPGVKPSLLGQVAEPQPLGWPHRAPPPSHLAGVAGQEPDHDLHDRRFAGPVRPEEAEEVSRRDGQTEAVECDHLAIAPPKFNQIEHEQP